MALDALPKIRGLVFLILVLVMVVLMLISFPTDIGSISTGNAKLWTNLFYSCSRATDDSVAVCAWNADGNRQCKDTAHHVRATQAFYILTFIVVFPAVVAGILDQFNGPLQALHMVLELSLGVVMCLTTLIGMILAFTIPSREFCDQPSMSAHPDFAYGASPIFMLFAWLCSIAMIVVAFLFPSA